MSSLLEMLMGQLGEGDNMKMISQVLGAKKEETKSAVPEILSLIMSGLANNSSKPEGAESLLNALDKDHDGSIMDDIPEFIGKFQEGPGNGILRHVLGDKRGIVEEKVSKNTGIDIATITKLFTMLAPLIMGILGRKQKQDKLGISDLVGLLGSEKKQAKSMAPKSVDILTEILGAVTGTEAKKEKTSLLGTIFKKLLGG